MPSLAALMDEAEVGPRKTPDRIEHFRKVDPTTPTHQAGRSLAERQDLETCPGRSGLGMPFGAGRHGTGEGAGENRRLRTLARRMDVADTMQRGDK